MPPSLDVPLRGSVQLSKTAIAPSSGKSTIVLRGLTASVMNMNMRAGECASAARVTDTTSNQYQAWNSHCVRLLHQFDALQAARSQKIQSLMYTKQVLSGFPDAAGDSSD